MAPGRSHNRGNGLLVLATFSGALYLGAPVSVAGWMAAGVALGFVLGPDLDVDGGNIAMHNMRRVPFVGRLLSWPWRFIWFPYAKVFKHRSFWTHAPLIGTAIRIIYLALLLWPVKFFTGWVPAWEIGAYMAAGLCLSDFLHWLMDN